MQSNLIQVLSDYSSSKSSGYLEIKNNSIIWKVYLKEGKLRYVDCSLQSLAQFNYYLYHQGWKTLVKALQAIPKSELLNTQDSSNPNKNIYERAIVWLYTEKHLDSSQFLQLIEDITQDCLETCLWMTQAEYVWYPEVEIPLWLEKTTLENLHSVDVLDVVKFLQQRLKGWQSCSPLVNSPHQRPYFSDYRDIERSPTSGVLSQKMLMELAKIMQRGLSFRQLSIYLNHDELHVAQILSPYIENKMIYLRSPQPPFDHLPTIPKPIKVEEKKIIPINRPVKLSKLVCIDDSPTILTEIQRFLKDLPLEITPINDPVQASSIIFRLNPDIILLDINMPKINGYNFCRLLRGIRGFSKTPIIMVTGNTGLIDKAKAKMSGATDYFTKPFTEASLKQMIIKYIPSNEGGTFI